MVRDDDYPSGPPVEGAESGEDFSFAAFVLEHAGCGDGVVELRLGERLLVEWCTTCAASRTFGLDAG